MDVGQMGEHLVGVLRLQNERLAQANGALLSAAAAVVGRVVVVVCGQLGGVR